MKFYTTVYLNSTKNTSTNGFRISISYCSAWNGFWMTIIWHLLFVNKSQLFSCSLHRVSQHRIELTRTLDYHRAEVRMNFKYASYVWVVIMFKNRSDICCAACFVTSFKFSGWADVSLFVLCDIDGTNQTVQFVHNTLCELTACWCITLISRLNCQCILICGFNKTCVCVQNQSEAWIVQSTRRNKEKVFLSISIWTFVE